MGESRSSRRFIVDHAAGRGDLRLEPPVPVRRADDAAPPVRAGGGIAPRARGRVSSGYEGFGLPPLEAMACGTPVITSARSSLPEVVGDAALLVDPGDSAGLADAMARIVGEEPLREDLRERGLKQAQRFSWDETARLTVQVYEGRG